MNTIKIALAAALITAASSASFASGLNSADQQYVAAQGVTDTYSGANNSATASHAVVIVPTYQATDAERWIMTRSTEK